MRAQTVASAASTLAERGRTEYQVDVLGRITAAVGPCIGPDSYEVGLDFLAAFADELKASEVALDELRAVPGVTTAKLGAQVHALDLPLRRGGQAHGEGIANPAYAPLWHQMLKAVRPAH